MFGIFGSQLLLSGVGIVAKNAFETSVAQSLKNIGTAINTRFKGNAEVSAPPPARPARLSTRPPPPNLLKPPLVCVYEHLCSCCNSRTSWS